MGLGLGGLQSIAQSVAATVANLVGQTLAALKFSSTQVNGSDAFSVTTNGARFHFGAGANDFASSDGTTVTFAGPLSTAGALTAATTLSMTALAGTAGSGTGIVVNGTALEQTVLHKVTIDFTAVQAAALTADVVLWTLPVKSRVLRVVADVTTKFIGGAIATCAMTCGSSAGGNQFLLSGNVFTAAITLGDGQAELGAGVVGGTGFSSDLSWAAATPVQCRFTSTVANLSALTQGSVTFYIESVIYP